MFFSWRKFDEGCWNYHEIPVQSKEVYVLPSGAREWQNNLRLFCHFGHYFAVYLAVILA